MNLPPDPRRRALVERVDRAAQAGEAGAEGLAREELAELLVAAGELAEAEAEWLRVVELFDRAGAPGRKARALVGLARTLEQADGRLADASLTWLRASRAAQDAGDPALELRAYEGRVTAALRQGNVLQAIATLHGTIADRMLALNDHRGLFDVHRHLAALHASRGSFERARDDLTRAQVHADAAGDDEAVLRVRLERRATWPLSTTGQREDWQELLDDASDLPDALLHGHPRLQRALGHLVEGDPASAAASAEVAFTTSLAAGSAPLALAAVLLLAEARDARGERAEALRTLSEGRAALAVCFEVAYGHGLSVVIACLEGRAGQGAAPRR